MPVFNFASTFGKKATSDYGPLIDQVAIFEKELAMDDGTISSGDHDKVIAAYNGLLAKYPFTPSQRSNIQVAIASHEKAKSDIMFDSYNLENIEKDYKDDLLSISQSTGNNIYQFLEGKRIALESKYTMLNNRVENIYSHQTEFEADRNALALRNEIRNISRELENVYSAMDAVENPKGALAEGLGIFIKTNKDGQVIDIDVGAPEGRSGYGKTNDPLIITKDILGNDIDPIVSDLQVYGNEQEGLGKDKVVKIGNNRYIKSALSLSILGESPVYTKESFGGEAGQGLDLSKVSLKQSVMPGDWIEGLNSKNLYQQKPDGSYVKYTGSTAEQRKNELSEMKIIPMPVNSKDESLYNRMSNETVSDMTLMPMNYQPTGGTSFQAPTAPTAPQAQTQLATSVSAPAGPTIRAPQEEKGIARRTLESAIGYFGSFFNR